jgi:prephenate dehydrogenase
VLTNIHYLETLKPLLSKDTILTDVGSVKGNIYEAVSTLGLEASFIGGHPMTGSEKTGYENADSLLMENAYYILTPTKTSSPENLTFLRNLVKAMGSIPIVLDCCDHDHIVAAISHVPHIIASSLVNMVRKWDDDEAHMFSLAAGGFKDITRIASSSPVMWQNICLTNQEGICVFLDRYMEELLLMKELISGAKADALFDSFQVAKDYRDSIPKQRVNAPGRIYELYLDIIDEAGAIASIATLLASNSINIKNIGILHNREFEEGVLHMEFYEESAVERAADLCKRHHYKVYQR